MVSQITTNASLIIEGVMTIEKAYQNFSHLKRSKGNSKRLKNIERHLHELVVGMNEILSRLNGDELNLEESETFMTDFITTMNLVDDLEKELKKLIKEAL
jgi:hypothetical protein